MWEKKRTQEGAAGMEDEQKWMHTTEQRDHMLRICDQLSSRTDTDGAATKAEPSLTLGRTLFIRSGL